MNKAPSRAWLAAFRIRLQRTYENPASDAKLEELLAVLEEAERRGARLKLADAD